jgi:manganese transport protein
MKLQYDHTDDSLDEVHATVETGIKGSRLKRLLAYLGPAYLVSVGYMDPGNWATDLQGGARFGYKLIWVLLMSNLMALLLQNLSARLGVVRRRDLAQANREAYPALVNFCLYVLAEIAIAACDLAEVLGMALGIYLLTGLPVVWGVAITVFDTLILLWLQNLGIRKIEAFIISLIAVIGVSFLIQLLIAKPNYVQVAQGFVPSSLNSAALYIAVGIVGATVMPHNLYLHSALVQTRKIHNNSVDIKRALKFNVIDSVIALNAAFLVNAAILIVAASVFFASGHQNVARLEDAHQLLSPLLGSKLAPILFAVSLIAAGQSSTITGTLAGQIVMEGYLRLRINPWLRRLLTRLLAIIPTLIIILIYGNKKIDDLLVFSQVILSLQLGFAVIPLIHFVSDKSTMGEFSIKWYTKITAWMVAIILVYLNVKMVYEQSFRIFNEEGYILWKFIISIVAVGFIWLFLMMTFLPLLRKQFKGQRQSFHGEPQSLDNLSIHSSQKIAIALDFSLHDEHLIAHALNQGKQTAEYILLHVVESASAKFVEEESDDDETRKDRERLKTYTQKLQQLGYHAQYVLGYNNRVREIIRIVEESGADMLVLGAHRHRGLKDYLFGDTIEAVRHELKIPVLIVNSAKIQPTNATLRRRD